MKFIIVDASQYASGRKELSPEYIDKLKGKYKLETIKTKTVFNKIEELTIVTINNIVSLVEFTEDDVLKVSNVKGKIKLK